MMIDESLLTCDDVGIAGWCGCTCPVLKRGECPTEEDMLAECTEEYVYTIVLISDPINVVATSKEKALEAAGEWLKGLVDGGGYELAVRDWNPI